MAVDTIAEATLAEAEPSGGRGRRKRKARRRRAGSRFSESRTKLVARWLLAFTIVGSVLAIGSVHVPVLLVAASVAIAAGTATFFAGAEPGSRWPAPAAVLALLAIYTAVQALPLPLSLLTHLEPATADVWSRSFTAIGERAPGWGAISLEPGASWVEALKWWAYAATFVAAAGVGAHRGARWGAALLLISAMLVALVSIAHGATDASKVYGFYAPRFGGERWHIGPLIDPNNLAGYLNLGVFAGLGLVAEESPFVPRWAIALAVAPVVGMSFIAESRGGFAALILGLVLLSFLLRRSRGSFIGSRGRRMLIPLAATLIGGMALALTAANHHVIDALLNKDVQKLKALAFTVPMMRAHPWFGVGRGAFQSVFQQYFVSPNDIVYSHPENFAVQWATEWGLPVAIVGLGVTGWLLRPRALGYLSSPAATGVFTGLAALVLQNVVDLSLEVPGVMFAAVAGAGFLWGEATEKAVLADRPDRDRSRALVLGVAGLVAVVLASVLGFRTIMDDRDDAIIDFPSKTADTAAYASYRGQLRAAMERHPAEPYFPRTGALLAWDGHRESPYPWLALALERAPTSGRTNYLLAVYLAQRHVRNQSLMELRLATDYDAALAPHAANVALALTRDPALLRSAVPDGVNGAPLLYAFAEKLPKEQGRLQDEFLEEATVHDPDYASARSLAARRLLSAMENPDGTGRCAGIEAARCAREINAQCDELERLRPEEQEPVVFRARLYMVLGHPEAAARTLADECKRFEPRQTCLHTWLEAASLAHDADMTSRAASDFAADGCVGQGKCGDAYTDIGETLTKTGDLVGGMGYFERAAREDPTARRWHRAADAATTVGDFLLGKGDSAAAAKLYEHAALEDPTIGRWRRVAELKEPHDANAPLNAVEAARQEVHDVVQKARLSAEKSTLH